MGFWDDIVGLGKRIRELEQLEAERKRAEEMLEESENKYRHLFESMNDAAFLIDAETGRIFETNLPGEQLLGCSREEIVGMDQSQLYPPEMKEVYGPLIVSFAERAEKGRAVDYAGEVLRKDGTRVSVSISSSLVMVGKRRTLLGLYRDVSRTQPPAVNAEVVQDSLQRMQEMETFSRLAGSIAHDFNNTLGIVLGSVELALYKTPEENDLRPHLERILQSCRRGRDLAHQIFSLSRQTDPVRELAEVHLLVKEGLNLLQSSFGPDIEVRKFIYPVSGTVLAGPTQIHQILMNLCTNAVHAMRDGGGVLEVSLGEEEVPEGEESQRELGGLPPGDYVKLSVRDTGHGMGEGVRERMFEPYFTTKEPGDGTGLGLAMVEGIVKNHQGSIRVETEPGRGTTVDVLLPRMEKKVTLSPEMLRPLVGQAARILFVDDEEALVRIAEQFLVWLGYEVVGCTSGLGAIEAFRARPDSFSLVITDMAMPGMSGMDLAETLRSLRPDLPVILCACVNEGITREEALGRGLQNLLSKPISLPVLEETIREVMK